MDFRTLGCFFTNSTYVEDSLMFSIMAIFCDVYVIVLDNVINHYKLSFELYQTINCKMCLNFVIVNKL